MRCSAWKLRATGLTSAARNVSLVDRRHATARKIDAFGLFTGQIGYAWNNALLYVKGGAAVTDNNYEHPFDAPATSCSPAPVTTPAGAAPSVPASNSASLRTGRSVSNTTICSCRIAQRRLRHRWRRALRLRQHPSGRRHGHRPHELPLGRPGDRASTDTDTGSDNDLSQAEITEKAGLAPAFLFARLMRRIKCRVPTAAISRSRRPETRGHFARKRDGRNKPLMVCTRHWKSAPVLPTFRAHPLASAFRIFRRWRARTRMRVWNCRHG